LSASAKTEELNVNARILESGKKKKVSRKAMGRTQRKRCGDKVGE
jgi:hypothetical protein